MASRIDSFSTQPHTQAQSFCCSSKICDCFDARQCNVFQQFFYRWNINQYKTNGKNRKRNWTVRWRWWPRPPPVMMRGDLFQFENNRIRCLAALEPHAWTTNEIRTWNETENKWITSNNKIWMDFDEISFGRSILFIFVICREISKFYWNSFSCGWHKEIRLMTYIDTWSRFVNEYVNVFQWMNDCASII